MNKRIMFLSGVALFVLAIVYCIFSMQSPAGTPRAALAQSHPSSWFGFFDDNVTSSTAQTIQKSSAVTTQPATATTSSATHPAGRTALPGAPLPGTSVHATQLPTAEITANGQVYGPQAPNQLGVFPQIEIAPKGQVQVRVTYPEGTPGDVVAVAVQDGGHMIGANGHAVMGQALSLDANQSIEFNFQATEQLGIYRISLRNGAAVQVVNLWADTNRG